MNDPVLLDRLRRQLADHAAQVEELFTEPVKVSIVVRNPGHPDGSRDVVVSSEDDYGRISATVGALTARGTLVEAFVSAGQGDGR